MSRRRSDDDTVSLLGTLADGVVGSGRRSGRLHVDAAGIEIDWWIGGDDTWHLPADGAAHVVRPGLAPAVDARVRVPGGETVLRSYAVAGPAGPLVVAELENESAGPVVVAWVVRAAPDYRIGRVALDGNRLMIDERARVDLPRAPLRWAVAPRSEGVRDSVLAGDAASGPFGPVATRRGDLEIAVLFPVAHRTRTRIATATLTGERAPVTLGRLPGLDDVERGWVVALEAGTQVELPDAAAQAAVDAARATLMIGANGAAREPTVAPAARAWGIAPPSRTRSRRRGAAVAPLGDPWPALLAAAPGAGATVARAAAWLTSVRDALVRVDDDRVAVFPHFPVAWLGQSVALDGAPTPRGPISFALRWHGGRPALLWDGPDGLRWSAPGLDPAWESVGGAGEALLAEIDTTRLLSLGDAHAAATTTGVVLDEPGTFT